MSDPEKNQLTPKQVAAQNLQTIRNMRKILTLLRIAKKTQPLTIPESHEQILNRLEQKLTPKDPRGMGEINTWQKIFQSND